MKKILISLFVVVAFLIFLLSQSFFPKSSFSLASAPEAPSYDNDAHWAALPNKKDKADIVPGNSDELNKQESAQVDVFYLYPTSYLLARNWNASLDNSLANFIVDNGILAQQASAFNGVAKVYAPRYRQVSLGGQVQQERMDEKRDALALAYSDIQNAFDFYMAHYNQGRPFMIASHSQGTTHAKPLIKYIFENYPEQANKLVAAYIIGNTVLEDDLKGFLPICSSPLQSNCYLSWNAILEGGDKSHWFKGGEPTCVNPLSWRSDSEFVSAEQNLGSIPLTGHIALKEPHQHLVGARCDQGILWITTPNKWIYKLGLFPGGGYHAYDYNLFYMNIRANVEQRVNAYLNQHTHQ